MRGNPRFAVEVTVTFLPSVVELVPSTPQPVSWLPDRRLLPPSRTARSSGSGDRLPGHSCEDSPGLAPGSRALRPTQLTTHLPLGQLDRGAATTFGPLASAGLGRLDDPGHQRDESRRVP